MHNIHVFNILTFASSFVNSKLKGQNYSLQGYYFDTKIEAGNNFLFIQQILGISSIKTMIIYKDITNIAISRVQSPLDKFNLENKINAVKKMAKKYNYFGGLKISGHAFETMRLIAVRQKIVNGQISN